MPAPLPPITPPKPNLPKFSLGVVPSSSRSNLFGFQGAPGSGKTTAACKFPNPLVLDFDKKLPTGIPSVPFWNPEFVNSVTPCAFRPNRRDALKRWLKEARNMLDPGTTLILDSYTSLMADWLLHAEADPQPYWTKNNVVDNFEVYRQYLLYNHHIFDQLKQLPCTVVVLFHEQVDRDEKGNLTGKFRPVVSGQFGDQAAGLFSNFFRCICVEEDKHLKYYWQIRSTNLFNALRGPEYQFPDEVVKIPAEYTELIKYQVQLPSISKPQ